MLSLQLSKIKKSLQWCSEVDQIVKPLLTPYGITYFNFYKEFSDGTIIRLSNHYDWSKHYFKKNYFNKTTKIPDAYLQKKLNYALWCIKDGWVDDVLDDAAENFNIGNGISLFKVNTNSIESFGFGSTIDNIDIINHCYLNNLEWLNNFCEHFKEAAAGIINELEQDKLILPHFVQKNISQQTYDQTKLRLPLRQMQCAKLLLQGKSAKEIARRMNLSDRTVEFYLKIIRKKLSCNNRTELILKLSSLVQ